jgi:putative endonuclease
MRRGTTGTRPSLNRQERERRGRAAETVAAWWLRLKGYRILDRRARTPLGEIDLVAMRGPILAFVEVKARARRERAQEAITPQLRRRIEDAARLWAGRRRGMELKNWRFDVIAIAPGRLPLHLRDAWRPER